MFSKATSRGQPLPQPAALFVWGAFALFFLSAFALAEEPEQNPPEEVPEITVVVTAERLEEPEAEASRQVFSIPARRIEQLGGESVRDVLGLVPGVAVRQYGARGAVTSISLRGHTSGQVLVLLDGRRLNTAQAGAVDLADIPLCNVERIEVMYGGGSTLYGADALGGVINIITRGAGERPETTVRTELGSFGHNREVLHTTARAGSLRLAFDVEHTSARNDYPYIGRTGAIERRQNAGFRALRGALRVDRRFSSGAELQLSYQVGRLRKRVPGSIQFPSPHAWQADDQRLFLASYRHITGDGQWRALLHHDEFLLHYVDPDAPVPIDSRITNIKTAFELVATNYSDSERFRATWGVELRSDRGRSASTGGWHSDCTAAAFVQGKRRRGANRYIGGLRLERHSAFGAQLCPHVGYAHEFAEGKVLRVNLTRSFRAPTFNDLYWQEDAFSVGNPNLRPELGHTLDVSFDRLVREGTLRAALFFTDLRQAIVWQPNARGKWQPGNVGRAQLYGAELSWHGARLGQFELSSHITLQRPTNLSPDPNQRGRLLPYQPQAVGELELSYRGAQGYATVVLRGEGLRYTNFANTASLPGFCLLDVHIGRKLGSHWQARLSLTNALDKRYELISGYPMPGRELKLALWRSF